MSILIKGMEMPKSCAECRFDSDMGFCKAKADNFCGYTDTYGYKRQNWCPLTELPDRHGDLIDRDVIVAEYDRQHVGPAGGARKIMVDAPTVIGAEGGEG